MTDEMIIKNAYEVIQACANFSNSTLNFCNSVLGILSAMDRGALQAASMTGPGLPGYGGNKGALNPIRYSGVSQCARSVTKLHNLATALTPIVSTGFSNLTGYDQDIVDQILGRKTSENNYVDGALTAGGLIFSGVSLAGDYLENIKNMNVPDSIGKIGTIGGGIVGFTQEIKDCDYAGATLVVGETLVGTLVKDKAAAPALDPYFRVAGKWIDDVRDPSMDTCRMLEEMAGEALVIAGVSVISAAAVAALAPAIAAGTTGVVAIGLVATGIYLAGDLIDGFFLSGKFDIVETVSDALVDGFNEMASNVGNAIQSGWNTFCSWFS